MPTIAEYIEYLKTYPPDMVVACHLWQVDDVLGKAHEINQHVTIESATRIINDIHNKIDSSTGINWDVLETRIIEDGDKVITAPEDLDMLWSFFEQVGKEDGKIVKDFFIWSEGTDTKEIIAWFKENNPDDVSLLFGE